MDPNLEAVKLATGDFLRMGKKICATCTAQRDTGAIYMMHACLELIQMQAAHLCANLNTCCNASVCVERTAICWHWHANFVFGQFHK